MSTPARMTWTAVDNISIKEHTECMQLQPLTTVGELNSIEQIEWRHVQPTKTVSKHKMVRERANKTMYNSKNRKNGTIRLNSMK